MTSTFSGLGTALSSLTAQQRGLDVTGQNIANANTEGYSRQQVDLESVGASSVPALWSTYQSAGGGVNVAAVQRIADTLLLGRAQAEHGQLALQSGRQTTMSTIETSYGEPSDTGTQASLASFWASMHDLANDPSAGSASRSVVLQQAQAVATGLNQAAGALTTQWNATKGQLADTVRTVNDTIASVAQLNQAIVKDTASGVSSNELQDQRDQLVLQLSDSVGATSQPQADGSVTVYVAGTAVVTGPTARVLQISGGSSLGNASTDPTVLTWNGATYQAQITSGQVGAMTEALNSTIPGYQGRLDAVAANLASTVNAAHAAGYDTSGVPGGPFFSGTTAATLTVAITDPDKIAASSLASPTPNLDGSNATALANLATVPGGADATYRQLVTTLGAETATAAQRATTQAATATSVDGARSAQSGVNLDEEMVNLMKYQHAYEGASRVINAIDSMLDTLINHTGLG